MTISLPYQAVDLDNHYWEQEDALVVTLTMRFASERYTRSSLPTGGVSGYRATIRDVRSQPSEQPPDEAGGVREGVAGGQNFEYTTELSILQGEFPASTHKVARLAALDDQGVEAVLMLPSIGVAVDWSIAMRCQSSVRISDRSIGGSRKNGGSAPMAGSSASRFLSLFDLRLGDRRVGACGRIGKPLRLSSGRPDRRADRLPIQFSIRGGHESKKWAVRVIFHIGNGGFAHLYASQWSEDPVREVTHYSALPVLHVPWRAPGDGHHGCLDPSQPVRSLSLTGSPGRSSSAPRGWRRC